MTARFTTVDEYIASTPDEVQVVLDDIRRAIHRALPGAGERISYQMPTITLDGRNVVHFAAWKHHVSVYPVPQGDEELERELARMTTFTRSLHASRGKLTSGSMYLPRKRGHCRS